jgi:hypothetical protein
MFRGTPREDDHSRGPLLMINVTVPALRPVRQFR